MPIGLVDGEFVITGAVTRLGSARIELLTSYPNGTNLYTVDGTAPSFAARLYIEPFSDSHTITIRALAWDANFISSWESDPVRVVIAPVYGLYASTLGGVSISVF